MPAFMAFFHEGLKDPNFAYTPDQYEQDKVEYADWEKERTEARKNLWMAHSNHQQSRAMRQMAQVSPKQFKKAGYSSSTTLRRKDKGLKNPEADGKAKSLLTVNIKIITLMKCLWGARLSAVHYHCRHVLHYCSDTAAAGMDTSECAVWWHGFFVCTQTNKGGPNQKEERGAFIMDVLARRLRTCSSILKLHVSVSSPSSNVQESLVSDSFGFFKSRDE